MTGELVFRRIVIATVIGVVKANCLSGLQSYAGHLELTEGLY